MSDGKRQYRKTKRAQLEEATRLRITESAVELHGTVGPARTSMSAIAERAGVRRSTLYRHFPDEEAVFAACSAHWSAANPPPDPARWQAIEDPDARLRRALEDLYAYYRSVERMMDNLLRDASQVPVVGRMLSAYRGYLDAVADLLMAGRPAHGRAQRRVRAAVGHALAFPTWRTLAVDQGLADREAADLMCRLVEAAEASRPRAGSR
jgi:AcrR family transcriptional regulator